MLHPDIKKALWGIVASQFAYVVLSIASIFIPEFLPGFVWLLILVGIIVITLIVMPGSVQRKQIRTVKIFLVLLVILPVILQHGILLLIIDVMSFKESLIFPLSISITVLMTLVISVMFTQSTSPTLQHKHMDLVICFIIGLIAIAIVIGLDTFFGPASMLSWILGLLCVWLGPSIGRMIITERPIGDLLKQEMVTVKGYAISATTGEEVRSRWIFIMGTLVGNMWAAPLIVIILALAG